jgi:hypothetical protein
MADNKKSVNLLPEYLRTDKNAKFLSSTIDQFIQTPDLERIDGFVGSKDSPNYNSDTDFYIKEDLNLRRNYQLEPALIFKDQFSAPTDVIGFDDIINELKIQGAYTDNLDRLFRTAFYSYDPLIDWDKLVNYNQYYWLPSGPTAILINDNTLDVDADIVGQVSYTMSNGYDLTNGLKLKFSSSILSANYKEKEYIVEGVGSSIVLVEFSKLVANEELASVYNETFDTSKFDDYPFDGSKRLPLIPEYITINKASEDLNPWSRYNRWFHSEAIRISAEINGQVPVYDLTAKAKRPIVEFRPNVQLFNFGKVGQRNVDLIDTTTVNAMASVEGTSGYYVDQVLLEPGFRVIFNADIDSDVRGKIYRVGITTATSALHLIEETTPDNLDSVAVNYGVSNAGKSWYYDNVSGVWALSQQHTTLNQAPLFDLFDKDGNSYAGSGEVSNFVGNQIFGYDVGTGTADSVLGFPLKYQNSVGVGSYLFKNYFMTDSFVVTQNSKSSTISTGITYIKINVDGEEQLVNVWKSAEDYQIPVIELQTATEDTSSLVVNCFNKPYDTSATVTAYVNGVKVAASVAIGSEFIVEFDSAISAGDDVKFKFLTTSVPNANGYYETPISLTNNPLNGPITDMTLSELSDHVATMVERMPEFEGAFPGQGNLRDVSNFARYGTRLIVNEHPIAFAQTFLGKKEHNVVDALRLGADQYNQFKMSMLRQLVNVDGQSSAAAALDSVLTAINLHKDSRSAYYRSDMLGYGLDKIDRVYTVSNINTVAYPIGTDFNLTDLSFKSVLVYLNDQQLVYGVDYTFDIVDESVELDVQLVLGDKIKLVYYPTTEGCFVPPTPSKLGLYPKFEPAIYADNSFIAGPVNVIRGHDGSIMKAYGDYRDDIIIEFEKRIYNNIKVNYDAGIFDVMAVLPGADRDTGYSLTEITKIINKDFLRWAGVYNVTPTTNDTFDEGNSWTWNYKGAYVSNASYSVAVSGYWRGIYKYFYDTDKPHTHPWEMLGFSIEPTWWQDAYGAAPYLPSNSMWDDLAAGLDINQNVVLSNYVRPGLSDIIPVDALGNLKAPNEFLVGENAYANKTADWIFGDQGPAESAWRRSSYWPFVVNVLAALTDPCKYTSSMYDLSRTDVNQLGQLTYIEDDLYLNPSKLLIDGNVQTAGYGVYVAEKGKQKDVAYLSALEQDLKFIDFNLFYKLGGFTSKDKLQIVIDSIDPVSASQGAVLPPEDYSLILNVSNPIKAATISGIIVQKNNGKFIVKGYDRTNPYFEILKPIKTAAGGAVTVGGVSSPFTDWSGIVNNGNNGLSAIDLVSAQTNTTRYYKQGQIVRYNGSYFRVKVGHTAQTTFDTTLFQKLSTLPMTGGASAALPSRFESAITEVPYGTEYSTIQEVYDLIVGYGAYLESQGFAFDRYNTDLNEMIDWKFSGKEFLYWTTQNWANNNLITLSPFSQGLKYQFIDSVVDNVLGGKYEYSLLKADGKSFPIDKININRQDGVCTIETADTEDGIFFAKLNSVQKEHGLVFNNSTMFNDTIYDIETGYRQRRMKFAGFRTANWNGDLTSPGFVYDSVEISDWAPYEIYLPGKVVRYNGAYYESIRKITSSATFNFVDWVKLAEKPVAQLLPNFDYKINQFEDFYSLDIDNFDAGQQELAQHLLGYTPRPYLNNIFTNPITQYKFYQGFIKEKGTKNAVDKLSKAGAFAKQGNIELNEEWAFRIGHYGSFETYKEIEFPLEEGTFLENPYVVKLVDGVVPSPTPLINYTSSTNLLLYPDNFNPTTAFESYVGTYDDNNVELTTAGYVRPDDVTVTAYNKNSLLDIANNSLIQESNTVWLGFLEDGGWTVRRYSKQTAKIAGVYVSAPATSITFVTDKHHSLQVGDVVSVVRFNDQVNGVYVVSAIPKLNQFTVDSTLSSITNSELQSYGVLFKFDNARFSNFADLASVQDLLKLRSGEKLWIDEDQDGKWAVYEKTKNYRNGISYNTIDVPTGQQLGHTLHASNDAGVLLVSAPGWSAVNATSYGRVWVYEKFRDELEKQFEYGLNSDGKFYCWANTATDFGYALSYDDGKGLYFAGAPAASRVKAELTTGTVVYSTGTGTTKIWTQEGIVKISSKDVRFGKEKTERVLVHPFAVNTATARHARFGQSIYTNVVDADEPTLLIVGAPGDSTYASGGNVYAYHLTSTATVNLSVHPSGISVASTSSITLTPGSRWGTKIVGNDAGTIIAISAPGYTTTDLKGMIQVFDENMTWKQTLFSPFGTADGFGDDIAVSSTGKFLFASSVDTKLAGRPFGKVAIYLLGISGQYELHQILDNPLTSIDLKFGSAISISNDETTLSISALGLNRSKILKFDENLKTGETTYDGGTTRFLTPVPDSGTVYVYNNLGGYFIQADELIDADILTGSRYGAAVVATDDRVYIGAPSYTSTKLQSLELSSTASIVVSIYENLSVRFTAPNVFPGVRPVVEVLYKNITTSTKEVAGLKILQAGAGYTRTPRAYLENSCGDTVDVLNVTLVPDDSCFYQFNKVDTTSGSWKLLRHQEPLVDVNTVKRIALIDSFDEEIVDYLDVYDPVKGRIPGIADQELRYRSAFDPAVYSIGIAGSVVDSDSSWIDTHVGELWWDLSTAKYMWYEQGDEIFRKNNWGRLFPGASIDVYEWVKSDLLPSEWAAQADTNEGLTKGISGQPKYPDNSVISVKQLFNNVTNSFENVYYFWVKNKVNLPDTKNRRISSYQVASLISDPTANGLKFAEILSPSSIAFANVQPMLSGKRINANIITDIIDNQIPRHTEWLLLEEGNANSNPTSLLGKKLFDSLLGHDSTGNLVPDSSLTSRNRYGISIRPRQSMFKDRHEALRNLVEFTNSVLLENRITGNYSFENLNQVEQIPDVLSGEYDIVVNDLEELSLVETETFRQAKLECFVQDGKIRSVNVIDQGLGYLYPPTVSIVSTVSSDARIQTEIDSLGRVVNATISNTGERYTTAPTLVVRPHTAIVIVDSESGNRWAKRAFDYTNNVWIKIKTQTYNTPLYWSYVDWVSSEYNEFKDYRYVLGDVYELTKLSEIDTGDYVKINNIGDGRYAILERVDANTVGNFSTSYNIIFSERGTIQILDSIWDFASSDYSFDDATLDEKLYDQVPDSELFYILTALKDNIFVKDLRVNWNLFFFKAVKYALTEQKLLDWAFKTSFINIKNVLGDLDQRSVYKLDNEQYFEDYIKEIKPYHSHIRNYTSNYTSLDSAYVYNTDFDLPSYYNTASGQFETIGLTSELIEEYPWKSWADNYKYELTGIEIADGGAGYTQQPYVSIVTAEGDTGSGAEATAYIKAGKVYKIVITDTGSGYTMPPLVSIVGTSTTTATVSPIITNSKVRKNIIGIKFDRVSATTDLVGETTTEVFTCPGHVEKFALTWLADPDKLTITPLLDGKLILSTDYKIEYYTDDYEGYSKKYSRFVFLKEIPQAGQTFKITYKKNINLYTAVDRIESLYAPTDEMPGKELPLLMSGVEYPATNLQGLGFDYSPPWDYGSYNLDSAWGDLISYYATAKLVSTADVGDNVLYLNTTTGIMPGQVVNILNSSTTRIRNDTVVVSVDTTASSITISEPLYSVHKIHADSINIGSSMSIKTIVPFNGDIVVGDFVKLYGISESGFDGFYTVSSIDSRDKFTVAVERILSTTTVVVPSNTIITVASILENISTNASTIAVTGSFDTTSTTYDVALGVPSADVSSVVAKLDNVIIAEDSPLSPPLSEYWYLVEDDNGYAILRWAYNYYGSPLSDHTYDITVSLRPTVEFWKTDTVASALDTELSAGTWNTSGAFVSALGVNPEDLIIDGDEFLSIDSGYAPEECVAGTVLDSIGINVYTRAPQAYALVVTGAIGIVAGETTEHNVGYPIEEASGIQLHCNNQIFERVETVDLFTTSSQFCINGNVVIIAPQANNTRAGYTIVGVGSESLIDNTFIAVEDQTDVILYSLGSIYNVRTAYVLVDGKEIDEVSTTSSYGYMLEQVSVNNTRACVKIYNLPAGAHTLQAWFFNSPYNNFNRVHEELFDITSSQDSFVLELPPGTVEPASAQAIVEISLPGNSDARKRLLPPWVSYYQVESSETTFDIDNKNVRPTDLDLDGSPYTMDNVKVYANGTPLRSGFDFTLDTNANQVNITAGLLNAGDVVAVMGLIDYDYIIVGNILQLATPAETDQVVRVVTFTDHDNLMMRTERFNGTLTKRFTLSRPALSDNFVWVYINGIPLTARYDYEILDDLKTIQLNDWISCIPSDDVMITTVDQPYQGDQILGYRYFKDMFGRSHYKRIANIYSTTLAKELNYYDTEIHVTDASRIVPPNPVKNKPGIILIDGERIEFFAKNGNVLSNLRRSTLGTGPASFSDIGTEVIDMSPQQTIPYNDTVITQSTITNSTTYIISTASNEIIGSGITLMTSSGNGEAVPDAVDQIAVYYGGRQLRKTPLKMHSNERAYDTTSSVYFNGMTTSSYEIIPPEFTINTSTQEIVLNIAEGITEGTKLTIVKTTATFWAGNESLLTSDAIQAKFLQARTAELPDMYYYGGDIVLTENTLPLTDDNEEPLEGY